MRGHFFNYKGNKQSLHLVTDAVVMISRETILPIFSICCVLSVAWICLSAPGKKSCMGMLAATTMGEPAPPDSEHGDVGEFQWHHRCSLKPMDVLGCRTSATSWWVRVDRWMFFGSVKGGMFQTINLPRTCLCTGFQASYVNEQEITWPSRTSTKLSFAMFLACFEPPYTL